MATGWEKMTRWAGIGNNRADGMGENDVEESGMDATTEEQMTPGEAAGPAEDEAELAQLRGERDQLLDRLARLQAEFDNARKRAEKERADAREYTVGATVEPFLSVMDNFLLALKAQGSADQLRSGVTLILKQMEEALKAMQVTPVETVGTLFDPRVHEALGSIESAEYPDHQVIEEIRRGYKLRDRLLRPAMVKIATNAAQVSE